MEPEGWNTVEIYLNGFSTSLPEEVQYKALTMIPGFENVKMFRPGYAIEYDYFPPHQLKLSLETQLIENLYFAGQINGTTGYEEAACQGLMAGINAHLKINDKPAFILGRDEAYIGVLIDDLITKGTEEPYRMFTSRAEYRILLRQDNADLRLTKRGFDIGLASEERMNKVLAKEKFIDETISFFKQTTVEPDEINPLLVSRETSEITQRTKLINILLRPQITINSLSPIPFPKERGKDAASADNKTIAEYLSYEEAAKAFPLGEGLEGAEILMKYESYIEKEKEQVPVDQPSEKKDAPAPAPAPAQPAPPQTN